MTTVVGDFELTMDELRVVARFATESAEDVLPAYEAAVPGDGRPRAAVDSAWVFINGERRTNRSVWRRRTPTELPRKRRPKSRGLQLGPRVTQQARRICTPSRRPTRSGTFSGRQQLPPVSSS